MTLAAGSVRLFFSSSSPKTYKRTLVSAGPEALAGELRRSKRKEVRGDGKDRDDTSPKGEIEAQGRPMIVTVLARVEEVADL